MNTEQFDKLMEAINEVSQAIVVGVIGLALIIALLGVVLINILQ